MDLKHLQFWQILILCLIASSVILIIFLRGKFKISLKDKEVSVGNSENTNDAEMIKPCNNCQIAKNLTAIIQKVFSTAVAMTTIEIKTMKEKQLNYAQIKLAIYASSIIQKYKETLVICGVTDPQLNSDFLFFRYLYQELIEDVIDRIKIAIDINGILEYTESDYHEYIQRQINTNKNYLTEFLDTRYIGDLLIDRTLLNELTESVIPTFNSVLTDIFHEIRNIGIHKEDDAKALEQKLLEYIESVAGLKITEFEAK